MDKTVGKVTVKQESILEGGHHIIGAVKLEDGLTGLKAGMMLYRSADGWRPLPVSYTTEKPAAILLEDIPEETSATVASAALHGAIRANKVVFANGAPVTTDAADALRASGIYILGDPLPGAAAPVVVADLGNHSVTAGEPLVLTFLVAAQDDGVITRQWYSNSSASTSGGTPLDGATGENYAVNTVATGTKYYYCVATNRLNNTEAAVTSAVSAVTVASA